MKAQCHADREHVAKGLCDPCYRQLRWKSDERIRKRSAEWLKNNPEKRRAISNRWHAKNPRKNLEWHLRRVFGLSLADYDELVKSQLGRCSICRKPMRRPCIDHNHSNGSVRGLLCMNCNSSLGNMGDNPVNFLNAIAYLCQGTVS